MGNDIEIRVRVANQSGPGIASLNTSLSGIRGRAESAATGLRTLATRADTASQKMAALAGTTLAATVAVQRLAAAADDASDNLDRLRTSASRAGTAVRNLGSRADDTSNRLGDLDTSALSLSVTIDGLGDASRNTGDDLRALRGSLGTLRVAGEGAANALGSGGGGGMGLRGQLIGVAVALGATLLPTIGAVAPMLAGLAAVGGGAALAMDDLKEKAKQLKKPFEEWQKVAEKAIAPHTTKAVASLKGVMKDLTPVIELGADTFGRITEKAAAFADSPAFKGALAKNAEMGAAWVEDFAGSVGMFTQAFLDFGTKSGPALDAWDSLLGGFLDAGLPGMFEGLEQGIGGSSAMLEGLASFINDSLLPSLGKISGSFTEAFGPTLGEMFKGAGLGLRGLAGIFEGLMEAIEPFTGLIADAFRAFNEVGEIALGVAQSFASVVGGALLESLLAVTGIDTSKMGDGFRGFSDFVQENEGAIRSAFYSIAEGVTSMVTTGISMLPLLYEAFQLVTEGVLTSLDGLVSGMAATLGNMPGMGWIKDMNDEFDTWAEGFRGGLDKAGEGIDEFVGTAIPNLNRAQIKLNISEAEQNLASIKEQLKDPELTKERRAKLNADKSAAEDALRRARADLAAFDRKKAEASLAADPRNFFSNLGAANRAKLNKKTGRVEANTQPFMSAVGGLAGRVLGTSYIDVVTRQVEASNSPRFTQADGGIMRYYADGGTEHHTAQIAPAGSWRVWAEPETGGEAYIPLAQGKRGRSRQIAEETVGILGGNVEWFAKGGMSQAQKDARSSLSSSFNISHFGRMAGYQNDPISKALGAPADLGALVSSLNELRGQIKAAFSGGKESSLLKQLDSVGKKLISYEKQLTAVNKSLESAKDKLNDLKTASSQLASSVKSGILSSANITKGASGDAPTTVASVMAGLTQSRDKASAFSGALAKLQKKGLSKDLIQQIAEAGIEGGGLETAGALLGASSSEIKSMNLLQGQINKSATAAGKATADAVYGAAIKDQTAAVKKLQATQDRLEKTMRDLANKLEKALQNALKGKAAGGIVGAAAAGGIRSNLTWVGEQGPELLDLPAGSRVWSNPDSRRMQQQAWSSMLNTPRGGSSSGRRAPAAGGVQPIVVHQTITLDGRVVAQQIFNPLREEIAVRGGSVQKSLGQGAG